MRRATHDDGEQRPVFLISIHALHEESDPAVCVMTMATLLFQSTLSMRRATPRRAAETGREQISIHALHEESDAFCNLRDTSSTISIHALHEESD